MHDILCESRFIKNDEEIDVLKWATKITVEGHIEMLKRTRSGMREGELESIFNAYC